MTTTDSFPEPMWFADSGVTNHCTLVVENLQHRSSYEGNDKLLVGNGAELNINALRNSSFASSYKFQLNDILYTPAIAKNILSQNSQRIIIVYLLEFYPGVCFVKDLQPRKLLLKVKGCLRNGLYFPASPCFPVQEQIVPVSFSFTLC